MLLALPTALAVYLVSNVLRHEHLAEETVLLFLPLALLFVYLGGSRIHTYHKTKTFLRVNRDALMREAIRALVWLPLGGALGLLVQRLF